jgi:hypothetical protein
VTGIGYGIAHGVYCTCAELVSAIRLDACVANLCPSYAPLIRNSEDIPLDLQCVRSIAVRALYSAFTHA